MNHNFKDLTGQRFGQLLILKYLHTNNVGTACYECKCDCGKIIIKPASYIKVAIKRYGNASCGCYGKERRKSFIPANKTHGQSKTKEYKAWVSMKSRCYDPNYENFHMYGGRPVGAIKVCDEWKFDFIKFYSYIGPAPSKYHSIDRIDVNKDYEPGNVRWTMTIVQNRNKSNTRFVYYQGIKISLSQYCEEAGLEYSKEYNKHFVIRTSRIRANWIYQPKGYVPIIT